MEDVSKELKAAIDRAFGKGIKADKTISAIVEKSVQGNASYEDAYIYAERLGGHLAEVFKDSLSSDVLPDGKMYYNIAQKAVAPPLEDNYKMAAELAAQVQQALNKDAGIGIKAITPKLDRDKVNGIVNRLSSEAHYDDVAWILDEPVKLMALSAVDDCIKANAEFQGKAGLTPKIIRRAESHCCKWCSSLAGEYEYPDVPKDVYRRHENCRCKVDYIPDGIKKQNIWSKKWTDDSEKRISDYEKKEAAISEANKYKTEARKAASSPVNAETSRLARLQLAENSGIINIQIDEFVPCLRDNKTGELVSTNVTEILDRKSLSQYNEKTGWYINWSKVPRDCRIMALRVDGADEIEGLVAFKPNPESMAIHGHWIVSNPHNNGYLTDSPKYSGVGGHLFAIMAQESVNLGYEGYIQGVAANQTVLDHYINKFNAKPLGSYNFYINDIAAQNLLSKYNWRVEK